MCQYCNDSVLEENMFLLPETLPHKLTQKDTVKWKYKVTVVISPLTATVAKHTEKHLWIHTPDVLLSIWTPKHFIVITNLINYHNLYLY